MTEYNYFCSAEKHNDENSFQQKRYRVFNTQITKEEYESISIIYSKLEFDKNESSETRFQTAFKNMWNKLDSKWRQQYLDIPHFNSDIFEFITGVKINDVEEMTVEEICKALCRNIKIV